MEGERKRERESKSQEACVPYNQYHLLVTMKPLSDIQNSLYQLRHEVA